MIDAGNNYFLKMLIKILEDGIYLGEIPSSKEYLENVSDYFNQDANLFCRFDYKTLVVEDAMCNPILTLSVRNNTLYILPSVEDNFFSCFIKIITYVTTPKKKKKNAKKEIDENEFDWI